MQKQQQQNKWEIARWHAFITIPNKRRTAKITDMGTFPWEQKADEKTDYSTQKKRADELAKKWQGGSKPNKMLI